MSKIQCANEDAAKRKTFRRGEIKLQQSRPTSHYSLFQLFQYRKFLIYNFNENCDCGYEIHVFVHILDLYKYISLKFVFNVCSSKILHSNVFK